MDEYMEIIKPNDIRDNPSIHADNNFNIKLGVVHKLRF